jgi:hypothetical protein
MLPHTLYLFRYQDTDDVTVSTSPSGANLPVGDWLEDWKLFMEIRSDALPTLVYNSDEGYLRLQEQGYFHLDERLRKGHPIFQLLKS